MSKTGAPHDAGSFFLLVAARSKAERWTRVEIWCTNMHRQAVEFEKKPQMKREYDFSKARRGPVVPAAPGKTRITIRLDNDVIEHFQNIVDRAGGGNYQTLINAALREYIQGARLEAVVRRTVARRLKQRGRLWREPAKTGGCCSNSDHACRASQYEIRPKAGARHFAEGVAGVRKETC